jgi:hypothetical protein
MPRRNQQDVIGPLPSRDPVSIPQLSRLSTPCRGVQWLSTRPLRVGSGKCEVWSSVLIPRLSLHALRLSILVTDRTLRTSHR